MVDIHNHILPGLDDGAQDIDDTLDMATLAVQSGVTRIIATPHCNMPGVFENYLGEEYNRAFLSAKRAIEEEKIPIELLPGMEVFGTYDLPKLLQDKKVLTLASSNYLLIEFAFDEEPEFVDIVLKRVKDVGVIPVIAHPERYHFLQDMPYIAEKWSRYGYLLQINKGSFVGRFGSREKKTAYKLLKDRQVSVIASDAHGPIYRTPYMLDAYEKLCEEYPKEIVDHLFTGLNI